MTTTLKEQITVSRDIDEAFAYTADFSHIADWDPGIARSSKRGDGPVQVGTEFDLVATFGGKEVPMVYTVTEFDPPNRVVLEGKGAQLEAVDTITFSSTMAGTRIGYVAELTFHNFVRFIEPLLSRTLEKVGERAVNGLKSALDG